MVEGARLEIVCTAMYRGFESPSLRHSPASPSIVDGEGRVLRTVLSELRQVREEATVADVTGLKGRPVLSLAMDGSSLLRAGYSANGLLRVARWVALVLLVACGGKATPTSVGPDTLACPDGTRERFTPGAHRQCVDKRGTPHGPQRLFNAAGVLVGAGELVQGRRVGAWELFHDDGTLSQVGSYGVNGLRDGVWRSYDNDGALIIEGAWRDGIETGPWREVFPNGRVEREGEHTQGARVGVWRFYHINGALARISIYDDGLEDTATCYSAHNEPVLCAQDAP